MKTIILIIIFLAVLVTGSSIFINRVQVRDYEVKRSRVIPYMGKSIVINGKKYIGINANTNNAEVEFLTQEGTSVWICCIALEALVKEHE